MTRESFDKVLKTFYRRRPFQPFTLELINGGRIEVNHPEALRQRREDNLLVYRSTTGLHCVLDCESAVRFIDATGTF
jgi:hypothetical protein